MQFFDVDEQTQIAWFMRANAAMLYSIILDFAPKIASRDMSSQSCQTDETSYVSCEICSRTQACLYDVGRWVTGGVGPLHWHTLEGWRIDVTDSEKWDLFDLLWHRLMPKQETIDTSACEMALPSCVDFACKLQLMVSGQ